jgi:hypothetical protein
MAGVSHAVLTQARKRRLLSIMIDRRAKPTEQPNHHQHDNDEAEQASETIAAMGTVRIIPAGAPKMMDSRRRIRREPMFFSRRFFRRFFGPFVSFRL